MKDECNENTKADIAERNERAKKLCRYVSDVARRIDEATANCRSVLELFYTNTEIQRQKLRDNCEKLMFLDPLNYGKKALELLWRKVYYETVSAAKKLCNTEEEYDYCLFTHIMCGVGQFHHIITRVKSEMKLQFKELDYSPVYKDEEYEDIDKCAVDEELLLWSHTTVHSCLIYLGDLSRYQAEIFHTFDQSIAARYYLQAAQIDLSSGMPYNQLGNLYLEKNHNLDSACYYIHCLSSVSPFEGAMGNLTKLFEKNAQIYEALDVRNSENLSQTEHVQGTISQFLSLIEIWYLGREEIDIAQRCNILARDLRIALDFKKLSVPDINKNFEEYIRAREEETINPSSLNGNIIHEIVQICIFTITKISETDEKKAFAAKAFSLAVLCQLLQKLLQQLQDLGLKNPASLYRASKPKPVFVPSEPVDEFASNEVTVVENGTSNGIKEDIPDKIEIKIDEIDEEENFKVLQNGNAKVVNKKILAKRRRRRRIGSSESSDVSDDELENSDIDTDDSSSKEDADENYDLSCLSDSKSEASDNDDTDTEPEIINSTVNGNDKNDSIVHENVKKDFVNDNVVIAETNGIAKQPEDSNIESQINNINSDLNAPEFQNFLKGDNFLASLKLLQDWILSEKDLILSCGESAESLFQCVVDLLNILEFYFKPKCKIKTSDESCKIVRYARALAKNLSLEYKKIPLPEDIHLRGTNVCKFDKNAAEWLILDHYKPSIYEENVIRILNFIDFGHQIAKIVPRIRYNRAMQIFYLKKISIPKLNTKLNHKRYREWHNSKTSNEGSAVAAAAAREVGVGGGGGSLPRRLGQLWLAARVRELERWGRAAEAAPEPALLVLDAAALTLHLRRVKQLARARSFLILVPTVVLQELDELKREQISARDAIRWLETQLQTGSGLVRAQRPAQTRPLSSLQLPRKTPPHVHNYLRILEFCHHFVAEEKPHSSEVDGDGENEGVKSSPMLVLLTGVELATLEERYGSGEFSVAAAARAAAVSVESIGEFYSSWRRTMQKSGKKR